MSQAKKFKVLNEVLPLAGKTVLDVGCGLADFAQFLIEHNGKVDYHGIDITPAMINLAQQKYPTLSLKCSDILEDQVQGIYDVVTANGIFYLLGQDAWPKMQEIITKMFSLSTEAVAFNSLSTWCNDPQENEFYADPILTVEFCRSITPNVTLRHDYHSRDFTIYLYKNQI